jgi:D-alanyl-D-alanine carboxypeptidase
VRLHRSAAEHFARMRRAAAAEGVQLVPISGFRSERHQQDVYTRQLGRARTANTATLVSAPPGYSEHHTGYAIDLGDGTQPGTDIQFSFERTAAFRWLQSRAGRYGFELSFPPGNPQQVSYEPWHWRFVGDRRSVETFYRAR